MFKTGFILGLGFCTAYYILKLSGSIIEFLFYVFLGGLYLWASKIKLNALWKAFRARPNMIGWQLNVYITKQAQFFIYLYVESVGKEKLKMKTLFEETKEFINKNYNTNFRYDALDWATRVWLHTLTDRIEERIEKLEKEFQERVILWKPSKLKTWIWISTCACQEKTQNC